jgi:BlaI family transcriptional regulator, penicillinase repressor
MTHIPDAELHLLEALWRTAPQSAEDLIGHAAADKAWAPSTVKTLLARMVKKGVIQFEKDGRRFLYRPLLKRDAVLKKASQSLLERFFDGRVSPLVAYLSTHRKLTAQDREELAKLLKELKP